MRQTHRAKVGAVMPKQKSLHDKKHSGLVWNRRGPKRVLRKLVRQAVREALLWQIIADDSEQAAVETIAKRLVP